jgi:hypothetical protein
VKNVPQIKIVTYHRGQKKVLSRDDANHVTFLINDNNNIEYFTFHKSIYNTIKNKKPTKSWSELPEII